MDEERATEDFIFPKHQWLEPQKDNSVRIGIRWRVVNTIRELISPWPSDSARVGRAGRARAKLPNVGALVMKNEPYGKIEASEILQWMERPFLRTITAMGIHRFVYSLIAPISGKVEAVNEVATSYLNSLCHEEPRIKEMGHSVSWLMTINPHNLEELKDALNTQMKQDEDWPKCNTCKCELNFENGLYSGAFIDEFVASSPDRVYYICPACDEKFLKGLDKGWSEYLRKLDDQQRRYLNKERERERSLDAWDGYLPGT
jgi:glycine cleavage system H lipoate-binding protein